MDMSLAHLKIWGRTADEHEKKDILGYASFTLVPIRSVAAFANTCAKKKYLRFLIGTSIGSH